MNRGKLLTLLNGGAALHYLSGEVGLVDASTVVVAFSKPVTATGSDYTTGVTIKVNGSTATISSGTRQTNQAVVYYVLSAPVTIDDTVTWEYTATTGKITGTNQKVLASVAARAVTNDIRRSLDFRYKANSMYLAI